MSPEERSILVRTHELAEENNKILKALNRRAKFSTALRVTYWIVVIGLSVGAFYFIQPYLNFLTDITNGTGTSFSENVKELLK